MLFNYANVLMFAAVGVGFVFVTLLVGSFVRPSVPTLEKLSTYECGEPAIGSDGTVIVGSYDQKLYAIGSDGRERWRLETR